MRLLKLVKRLDVFKVPVPAALTGKTLAECLIRRETGCSVIGIDAGGDHQVNPPPETALPAGSEIILIGSAESEEKFLKRYIER